MSTILKALERLQGERDQATGTSPPPVRSEGLLSRSGPRVRSRALLAGGAGLLLSLGVMVGVAAWEWLRDDPAALEVSSPTQAATTPVSPYWAERQVAETDQAGIRAPVARDSATRPVMPVPAALERKNLEDGPRVATVPMRERTPERAPAPSTAAKTPPAATPSVADRVSEPLRASQAATPRKSTPTRERVVTVLPQDVVETSPKRPTAREAPLVPVPSPEPAELVAVAVREDPTPVARTATRPEPEPAPRPKPEPAPVRAVADLSPPPAAIDPSLEVAVLRRAPEVAVERTVWHPDATRRTARVRVAGREGAVTLHEGDAIDRLVVAEIQPSGVVFLNGGERLQRRVGE